jgi:putative Mn2+ efflux pump MntP
MTALFVLAFALAMDAFAVSVVRGSARDHHISEGLRLAVVFGLAQGLMPLVGWGLGVTFADAFKQIDHWIAFVLLAVLGVRMTKEGLSADEPASQGRTGPAVLSLIVAAFATSIDAAAAGITLPLLGVAVPLACLTIGATTAVICLIGYEIGGKASLHVGKWAEVLGGIILIGLGTRILIQHVALDG